MRPSFAIGLVILVAVTAYAVPDASSTRLFGTSKLGNKETIADADPKGSAAERFKIQQTALRITLEKPAFGVGLGAYPLGNNIYAPELGPKDTHNTYLNLAAEIGIPGLLLWCAMATAFVRSSRKRFRTDAALGGLLEFVWLQRGVVAFLITRAFGTFASLSVIYIALGTLWCCAAATSVGSVDASPARKRAF